MATYLISFNQQWVGDHPREWVEARGPLARAVVAEMERAGVLVFAGGLVEDVADAIVADDTSGSLRFTSGPYRSSGEHLGGMTLIDVPDDDAARMWAGRLAVACGWPQEVRRFAA